MPKVKIGDINMYYEVHGKGETLVLIGGGGASVEMAAPAQIPVYSSEYQLVLFDNRGAGQSDKPDIPYTTAMMADDLAGLLDVIGIKSAHICGTSMGGMIAQQFALRYPERVKSLILQSTYCGGPNSILPEETMSISMGPKLAPEKLARKMIELMITQEFIKQNPALIRQMLAVMSKNLAPSPGMRGQGQAVKSHNTYERLPRIKAPTLVIHGDADRALPVTNSRIIASRIPGAELVILKNAGHILIEAGDEPNRIMLDFLRRHSKSRKTK
jgi:pimeloyl-ACP methyl ester carboxylesterase